MLMTLQQTCSNYEKIRHAARATLRAILYRQISSRAVSRKGGAGRGANASKQVRKCKTNKHRRSETTQKKGAAEDADAVVSADVFIIICALRGECEVPRCCPEPRNVRVNEEKLPATIAAVCGLISSRPAARAQLADCHARKSVPHRAETQTHQQQKEVAGV